MADFTIVQLRDYLHAIAPFIIPRISTWSATGDTTYGIDIYNAYSADSINQPGQFGTGLYIYQPAVSSALNRVRPWGPPASGESNPGDGKIYINGTPWTAPVSGQRYESWSIDPKHGFDVLSEVSMRNYLLPAYGPLQRFTNADCQSVTGWSANVGTVALETDAAHIQTGKSSIKFTASGAGDYAIGPSFSVTHNTSQFLSVNFKVAAGDAAFYPVLYDETNSAEIQSSGRVGHAREQFCVVQRMFEIPDGCERAHFRLVATNTGDIAYIDYVNGPWKPTDKVIDLPSTLNKVHHVRKVITARYEQPISSINGGYDAFTRAFSPPLDWRRDYGVRINHGSANANKLEITQNYRFPNAERWIEIVRPAYDLCTWAYTAAGDSSPTCPGDVQMLGMYWLRDLDELAVRPDPRDLDVIRSLDVLLGEKVNGKRKGGRLTAAIASYERDLETPPVYDVATGYGLLRY